MHLILSLVLKPCSYFVVVFVREKFEHCIQNRKTNLQKNILLKYRNCSKLVLCIDELLSFKMPKGSKLKGKMSSYAFFVQTCREEQKKKHPDESVVFSEFSKKCSEKWKVEICALSF